MCNIELLEIVPGRCISVSIWALVSGLKRNLHILTLHNFGLSVSQVKRIGNIMNTIKEDCRRQPTLEFACLVGDFNFLAGRIVFLKWGDHFWRVLRQLLEEQARGKLCGNAFLHSGQRWCSPSLRGTINTATPVLN